jgi:hypothetical protein
VLDAFFGSNYAFSYTDSSTGSLPGVTRSYTSFDAAAQEAGMSRIYGGIHYTFDNTAGLTLGQQVGNWTLQVFNQSSDTTPPQITFDQSSGLVTSKDTTITGHVTDNLSGVASLAVAIDGGTAQTVAFDATTGAFSFTIPLALDGSADGTHLLTFAAVDAAGNVTTPLNFGFALATKAPQITLASNSVQDGGVIGAGDHITGTASVESGDALTGLNYSFDGGVAVPVQFVPSTGTFDQALDLSSLLIGNHTLTLTATDAAGNQTTSTLNVSLPSLPPLTITDLTPMMGGSDIGVTFHPQIIFSRAVDVSTLTSTSFYATDTTGATIPATIVAIDNNKGAYLFFTNPLPGASTITLHVNGSQIRAQADGALLDAAGTGTPGSNITESFTTVSTAPVPGTTISGIVVDPGPDLTPFTRDDVQNAPDGVTDFANDVWKLPIAGVKVYILGHEDQAVFTDAQGHFTLTNAPAGDVKVEFDGTTVTNAPAGFYFPNMVMDVTVRPGVANTIMGGMGTLAEQAANTNDPAVYLPRLETAVLQTVNASDSAVLHADPGAAPDLTPDQQSELSITVPPGSFIGPDGQPLSSAQIGISTVPVSIIQGMLPPGISGVKVALTLQAPDVAKFTAPLQATFPNTYGAAPGAQLNLFSYDHATGRLTIDGTATVSSDGKTVTTDPGSGIQFPGWFYVAPPGCNVGGCGSSGTSIGPVSNNPMTGGTGNSPTSDPNQPTPPPNSAQVYFPELIQHEGGVFNHPYVVLNANGQLLNPIDGITIGAGVNLAAMTKSQFQTYFSNYSSTFNSVTGDIVYSDPNIQFLYGAVGLQGQPAVTYLGAAPGTGTTTANSTQTGDNAENFNITIPQAAANALTNGVITNHFNDIVDEYNSVSLPNGASRIPFALLPPEVQTVAVDVGYLYPNTPNLFSQIATGNWNAAIQNLRDPNQWQTYDHRLPDDANILQDVLNRVNDPPSPPQTDANCGGQTYGDPGGFSVPQTGIHYYAVLNVDNGEVVARGISQDGLALDSPVFLAAHTNYRIFVLQPTTQQWGYTDLTTGASGQSLSVSPVLLGPAFPVQSTDGLSGMADFILGLDPNKPIIPGITDYAALNSGLLGNSILASQTGVIADLSLQGTAEAIALKGTTSSGGGITAYVATGGYGLAVADVSNFRSPVLLGQLQIAGGNAEDVAVDSNLNIAAVAANAAGLVLVDVTNPQQPRLITSVSIDASHVAVKDGIAYASVGGAIDAIDMATGEVLQKITVGSDSIDSLGVDGNNLYALSNGGTSSHTVTKFTIGNQLTSDTALTITGHPTFGRMYMQVGEGYIYIGGADNNDTQQIPGVEIIQDTGSALQLVGAPSAINAFDVATNGSGLGLFFGAAAGAGPQSPIDQLGLLNLTDPTQTGDVLTTINLGGGEPWTMQIAAGEDFIADGSAGLKVVNYEGFDTKGVPPTVTITGGPTDVDPNTPGIQVTEGSTVSLQATVADDVQVRDVAVLVNGSVVSDSVSFPWDLSAQMPTIAANGSDQATLQLEAVDTGGNSTISAPITLQLVRDTTPPRLVRANISEGGERGQGARAFIFDFSKPLSEATVTATTFLLLGPNNQPLTPQSIEFRNKDTEVQINYAPLAVGQYQFDITAPSVTDRSGNALGTAPITTDFTVVPFTASWNNQSGGDWSTGSNWDTGQVPGISDNVLVSLPMGSTVTYSGSVSTINSLVEEGGTLELDSGSLAVTNSAQITGSFVLTGGTFAPGGNTTINALSQSGGELSGSGTVTVSGAATLAGGVESGGGTATRTILENGARIAPTVGTVPALDGGRVLELQGGSQVLGTSVNFDLNGQNPTSLISDPGSGILQIDTGAVLDDQTTANGLNIFATNRGSADSGSTAAVINQGIFQKTGSATDSQISVRFDNAGTVDVESGTLKLTNGGTDLGATYTGAGTVEFAGGVRTIDNASSITPANVTFSGGQTTISGTYNVAGTTTISGGTAVLAGPVINLGTQLEINSGELDLGAANASLASMTQVTGELSGSGTVTVNGVLTLLGAAQSGSGTTIAQGGVVFGSAPGGNLVTNGGFETGDLSGWTNSGNAGFTTVASDHVHSGAYATDLGPVGSDGSLRQNIATIAGEHYTLDFWLANDGGSPNDFSVSWNSSTLPPFPLVNANSQTYTEYTYNLIATGTSTPLEFDFRQDPAYWHLDDISVTAQASIPTSLDGGRVLQLAGTSAATGSTASMDLNGANPQTGVSASGSGTLTIGSGATFDDQTTDGGLKIFASDRGAGDSGNTAIVNNQGIFEKSGSAASSQINVAFNTSGTVDVQSGTLDLNAAVTNTGTFETDNSANLFVSSVSAVAGTGHITGTSTIEFAGAASTNVTFAAGSTGTLQLDSSASYSGTITGFTGAGTGAPATSDKIDLRDVNFTSPGFSKSYVNNVLTVSDGTHTANINFSGSYTLANFQFASDGANGTLVTDPPTTPDQCPAPSPSIADGSTLKLIDSDARRVDFLGKTGLLELEEADTFSGQITGFGGENQIDLANISLAANSTLGYSQGNTGGTLCVSEGVHTAHIVLLGQYMASNFAMTSDGHGGTLITGSPPNQELTLAATHT